MNFKKFFTLFFLILMIWIFSGNAYAGEKKAKWISYEFEIKYAPNQAVNDAISVGQIPLYLRTVDVHRDDPCLELSPLPSEAPFSKPMTAGSFSLNVKIWLFDTIGLGFRFLGSSAPYLEETISITDPLLKQNHTALLGVATYNYAQHYHNWKPAYVMYKIIGTKKEALDQKGIFLEVKTPTLNFKIGENTKLGIDLFGGYELKSGKIEIHAFNGWHRRGEFEEKDHYKLGEIKFDQFYWGASLGLIKEKYSIGIKLFTVKDLQKSRIFPVGKEFGLKFSNTPSRFGMGLYVSFH